MGLIYSLITSKYHSKGVIQISIGFVQSTKPKQMRGKPNNETDFRYGRVLS